MVLGGMNRQFRRRKREDQPSMSGIYERSSQHVPEEGAISHRILAIYDYVSAKDHELPLPCTSDYGRVFNGEIYTRRENNGPSIFALSDESAVTPWVIPAHQPSDFPEGHRSHPVERTMMATLDRSWPK
jgi:hypothetical protein